MVDSQPVLAKALNHSSIFKFDAQLFEVRAGEITTIQLINADSMTHSLTLESHPNPLNVAGNSSAFFTVNLDSDGIYRLYEGSINGEQMYLGLSAAIIVKKTAESLFFWNLKEFDTDFNRSIMAQENVDFTRYKPKYFMINGKSNPEIGKDSLAKIKGKVNEKISLYMLNSGNSVHSLHFHGYHFTITHSSRTKEVINWEKDTYAIYPHEAVIIEFVPDKPGEYPVHDHNLVATAANNIYPNGMFTTMVIEE
jgi:FtsP/CotA-like multicopper oxidase with cupredoxin domain